MRPTDRRPCDSFDRTRKQSGNVTSLRNHDIFLFAFHVVVYFVNVNTLFWVLLCQFDPFPFREVLNIIAGDLRRNGWDRKERSVNRF